MAKPTPALYICTLDLLGAFYIYILCMQSADPSAVLANVQLPFNKMMALNFRNLSPELAFVVQEFMW